MIVISDNAVLAIAQLLKDKNATAGQGLRVAVERGGCAGLQYVMKVDDAMPDDVISERDGVKVLVSQDSKHYLQDCVLEFSDALSDAGFKIENPNAVRSCGCGTSFEMANEKHEAEECV